MNITSLCSVISHLRLLFKASPGDKLIEDIVYCFFFFPPYFSILSPFSAIKKASNFPHNLSTLYPNSHLESTIRWINKSIF